MPIYVGLMKLTEQGAKDIKNAPESMLYSSRQVSIMFLVSKNLHVERSQNVVKL
jgi:uncharacterized protein with GYD domain